MRKNIYAFKSQKGKRVSAVFKLEDVSFAYDLENPKKLALNKVNLHIKKGEWWSIIGSNGSGKSTLARHLNGLLFPSAGKVLTDGLDTADPANLRAIRRKVGIVFQNPDNQIIGNTVEEDIAFGPENLGVEPKEIRARITKCLAMVGLQGFEKADPNNLSGGQKQRVAIAGALAMEPQALILDEATAMLDPQGCSEVFAVLHKLHADGMTILMITHNMSEVIFSDRVAVMRKGELMSVGTPQMIFAQTDQMKNWGIELPIVNRIGEKLVEMGVGKYLPEKAEKIPAALTMAELVDLLK